METGLKIGVDFDDVLLDCNTSLAHFHNTRYGSSYERKDVRSWHLEHVWSCTRQEAVARVEEWYSSPYHAQSLPVMGALEAIDELARSHELHIITSRPARMEENTRTWLNRYFSEHFTALHFTSHFEPGAGSKSEVCKHLGISFLIEDSLVHARDVAASGVTVLLLDCPWNQEEVSGNIIRISTWKDVVAFITSAHILTK